MRLDRAVRCGLSGFAVLLLLALGAAPLAAAADGPSRLDFGVQLGYTFPHDTGARRFNGGGPAGLNDLLAPSNPLYEQLVERLGGPAQVVGPVTNARLDPVVSFHGFLGYAFTPRVEGRLALGVHKDEATAQFPYLVEAGTEPVTGTGTLSTDFVSLSWTAEIRRFFPAGRWAPYVGGGLRLENVIPGKTEADLAGVTFTADEPEGKTTFSPVLLVGTRLDLGGSVAGELELAVAGTSRDDPDGSSVLAGEPEIRVGFVWSPGSDAPVSGAAGSDEAGGDDGTPPPEKGGPPPPESDLGPPPEKGGPCEWTRERFQILLDGFPMPDLDLFCKAAEACLEAARAEQARKDAEERLEKAKADLAETRKWADRFADYLRSGDAAKNQKGDPGLTEHYRKVTADYQKAIDEGEAEVAKAEAAVEEARATEAEAKAACEEARARAEAELEKLRKLQNEWKGFQADLARCVTCEDIEVLDRQVKDILEKIRAARKKCEDALLGENERAELDKAEADYTAASEQAAADAAAHDEASTDCEALAEDVREAYQECVDRSLEGIDHVTGDRERGYPMKRSLSNGLDDDLPNLWFKSGADRSRFYRAMKDCLRAKKDGHTTKPNVLTKRSDLRKCKRAEKRAWRKAKRSQAAADGAEAAVREARARLGDAAGAFGPFDDLEAWAAGWSSFLVEAGKDCEIRVKRCREIRRDGEDIPPLPDDCDPGDSRDRAWGAANRADDAAAIIAGLLWGGCDGGRNAVAEAKNDAAQVLGENGALDAMEKALAERDAALAEARKLLVEGKCEEAAVAYRKAREAAERAAEACKDLKKKVAKAEASAQAAADAADGCKEADNRRSQREADRRDRQEREARAQAAATAQARADAEAARKKAKEEAARRAIECWNHYLEWLIDNLGEDEANEIAQEMASMGQLLANTSASWAQAMAEAAARGKPSAGVSAAGISGGVFQLGVGLFYTWMQWELEGAVAQLDRKITLGRTQMELLKQNGSCGAFVMGSDKFFFIRNGNAFHVWRISEEPGLFGGTKHEYLGEVRIR